MKLPRRVHRGVCMPLTWLAGLCGCTAADSKGRTAFMRHILGITDEERQQRRWVGDWSNLVGATSADSQFCDAGPAPVVARLPHYLTAPLVA